MTYILPIITSVSLLLASGLLAVGQEPLPEATGNALVAAAVDALVAQPALEAKVRQRATIFGQLVSGTGLYLQARDGNRLLVRYEFRIQFANETRSQLQVNDGSTLWIRRDLGQLQSQAYIDLRRLRQAMSPNETSATSGFSGSEPNLAVGGLAQLLQSLGDHFHFGEAVPSEIHQIPIWELKGEWKPDRLLQWLPEQRAAIETGGAVDFSRLPVHLPSTVKLTLGRDHHFPLFPYRIEFSRVQLASSAAAKVQGKAPERVTRPMVTLELYEVRRLQSISRELFAYVPGDQNVEDRTEEYLRKLFASRGKDAGREPTSTAN